MQMWTVIIILKIVYEIVKVAKVKRIPAAPVNRRITNIEDPAAFAVRQEYLYRI